MLDTKAIAVVGRPKSGKTYWTKARVSALGQPFAVWDINGEWGATAPDELDFVQHVKRLKRSTIVWEEATTFLNHPQSRVTSEVQKLISRRRHGENTHFLLFTSLRQIPVRILDNLDRIILFKTNDMPANVYQRFRGFPKLLTAYEKVTKNPSTYEPEDVHIFGA